jgi:SAM-dependent methyltransferase
MNWRATYSSAAFVLDKIWNRVIPNARYLPRSRLRTCRACRRATLVLAIGDDEEFHICVRCRANLRYEMLAMYLTRSCEIASLDVLELDPSSPLRPILAQAHSYTRTFFRPDVAPGSVRGDGVVCQDITRLTYPDESLDLIVSSDVLEHVPDVAAAFRESARVLRPGGAHVFTVPPRAATRRRAVLENGGIVHLVNPPEYHLDPLDKLGVLAYWDYGPDLPDRFPTPGLDILVVLGPEGLSGRVVWAARKL